MTDRTDRTACPAFELLATAYHEAGHAVVDYAVWPANPVQLVTVMATKDYEGIVRLGGRDEAWRAGLDDDLAAAYLAEVNTIGDLAGNVAVALFLDGGESLPLPPARSGDSHNAHANALCTWDGVDGQWLQPRDYLERTRDVLERPDVWLAITRLASALLRRRTLTGVEVADIVRACGVTCERAELPLGQPDPDERFDDEAFSWSRW